jgi:hypothetical protein
MTRRAIPPQGVRGRSSRYLAGVRSLNELAAEILSDNKIVSWEGVRHVCRLLLAYADYCCASADSRSGRGRPISDDPKRVLEVITIEFKELQDLQEDCELAWREFQNADWPRGAFDVWAANDDRFCAALERNTQALKALMQKYYGAPGP